MSLTSSRPLGVSFLALLFLAVAIVTLGLAGFVLVSPDSVQMYIDILERLEWSAAWSSLLAVPPLLTAGLAGLLFNGLWRQREWARLAALVIVFLFALTTIVGIAFVTAFQIGAPYGLVVGVTLLVICAILFVYLLRTPFGLEREVAVAAPAPRPNATPEPGPSSAAPYIERMPSQSPPPYQGGFVPPPPREPVMRPAGIDAETVAAASLTQKAGTAATAGRTATLTPKGWLIIQSGQQYGQQFPLHPDVVAVIGRDASRVDILITDPTVSGRHAQIRYEDGRFVLHDLGSTNGISMGGHRIQRWPLQEGDEFRLGNARLVFAEKLQ
ncbi:MAG: FHA domain-containing protein [Caldilineales bacterium]|nr:FHA domain-containing protein [Caldilineales bacterium]